MNPGKMAIADTISILFPDDSNLFINRIIDNEYAIITIGPNAPPRIMDSSGSDDDKAIPDE
ncbi:hypothetical protein VEE21_42000 [Escherichia coli]|nr:hypothetical protein VEE21_42000 [Escherichia coli]HEI2740986.1 hypothetical protein [Escherichia coli]